MSNQPSNPAANLTAQAAAQAAQSAMQAAKAKSQTDELLDNESAESAPSETDEQLAKAWGFSVKRPKFSREALIGLVAIMALLGLFGYVAVRHLKNRSTVAEKSEKLDPNVKPASNSSDPFEQQGAAAQELDEFSAKSDKPKASLKAMDLEEDSLDIGNGQSEPTATKVVTKKQNLPTNLDDEFETFAEDTKTTNLRTQPKAAAAATDMPEFEEEATPPKANRATANLTLDFEAQSEPEESPPTNTGEPAITKTEPALTRTTEPIRLKQPVEVVETDEPPAKDFQEPVSVGALQRPKPKDDFETVPQRARRPVKVAEKDLFAERAAFDDPKAASSPTSDPAREKAGGKTSSRHPLLREGEYLVEEGDNFCSISKKLYGSEKYYLALAEHNRNRVADPCRMRPGLIISAPSKEVLERQHATLIPKPKISDAKPAQPHSAKKVSATSLPAGMFYDDKGVPWYRVGKGDTLTGIAQAHLGRISRANQIINLNRDRLPNPNSLRPGQELRLPNDASQVRLVETGNSLR